MSKKPLSTAQAPIGIERLRTLYAVIAGVPEGRIDLRSWFTDGNGNQTAVDLVHTCGTTGCAVGWACSYPEFRKQGLTASGRQGIPKFGNRFNWYAVESFFCLSSDEAGALFSSHAPECRVPEETAIRGDRDVDMWLNDKWRVLRRIRRYLRWKGVISEGRNAELSRQEMSPK